MINKISDEGAIKAHVVRVLRGEAEWWDAPDEHYPAGPLIDLIEEIEGMQKSGGIDTNGWQWDWWQTFIYKNGKSYELSGSGYSGGHCFHLSDEID